MAESGTGTMGAEEAGCEAKLVTAPVSAMATTPFPDPVLSLKIPEQECGKPRGLASCGPQPALSRQESADARHASSSAMLDGVRLLGR